MFKMSSWVIISYLGTILIK